jgi:hypothetical protein
MPKSKKNLNIKRRLDIRYPEVWIAGELNLLESSLAGT